MRQIEKRVIDDPQNNIKTRQMAIKQAKRMRNGAKTDKERRDIGKLIERLEAEIQAIIDKQNGATDDKENTVKDDPKKKVKTTEEVQAILDRLNEIQKKFK